MEQCVSFTAPLRHHQMQCFVFVICGNQPPKLSVLQRHVKPILQFTKPSEPFKHHQLPVEPKCYMSRCLSQSCQAAEEALFFQNPTARPNLWFWHFYTLDMFRRQVDYMVSIFLFKACWDQGSTTAPLTVQWQGISPAFSNIKERNPMLRSLYADCM